MKAQEYFDKFGEDIYKEATDTAGTGALTGMLKAMLQECIDIAQKRNIRRFIGLEGVIKEQNDKWNAFSRIFNEHYGEEIIRKDGFMAWFKHEMNKHKNGNQAV